MCRRYAQAVGSFIKLYLLLLFIRVLLDKKYALPHKVLDALEDSKAIKYEPMKVPDVCKIK